MADKILSDGEMDALMDSVDSGQHAVQTPNGVAQAKVRAFEISPRAHLRFGSYPELQRLNERIARTLQLFLKNSLNWLASCDLKSQVEISISDLEERYSGLQLCHNYSLDSLPGQALFLPDRATVFALLEVFFGSTSLTKAPTDIDRFSSGQVRVAENFAAQFFQAMAGVWEGLHPIKPVLIKTEQTMERVKLGPPKEKVIVSVFQIEIDDFSAEFALVLPVATISNLLEVLEGADRPGTSEQDLYWQECWQAHVTNLHIPVIARTQSIRLTLGRVKSLETGQTLPIATPDSIEISCGDTALFSGKFGSLNNNCCVRVQTWSHA